MLAPWDMIYYDDPNRSCLIWKTIFYEILNIHAPMHLMRTGPKLNRSHGLHLQLNNKSGTETTTLAPG